MDYNVYCDESCHLEHDGQTIMALGAIWCPADDVQRLADSVRQIKAKHNARGELKWTKVSPKRLDFYLELVDFSFAEAALHFRCLIVEDKARLDHEQFNKGSHDTFYYKMYYYLLRNILTADCTFRVYVDIKDTRSQQKVEMLKRVLCNSVREISGCDVAKIQQVRSHESELLQLADFLLGAVSYVNRDLASSAAKNAVVSAIQQRARHELTKTSPPWEPKFNVFVFSPSEVQR